MSASVYSVYTGNDELIGMDHPLFMARWQARMSAAFAARAGHSLQQALHEIPRNIAELFGEVPASLITATICTQYTETCAAIEREADHG